MYKLPPAERGRSILHERHKTYVYDMHQKKVDIPMQLTKRIVSFAYFFMKPPCDGVRCMF